MNNMHRDPLQHYEVPTDPLKTDEEIEEMYKRSLQRRRTDKLRLQPDTQPNWGWWLAVLFTVIFWSGLIFGIRFVLSRIFQ